MKKASEAREDEPEVRSSPAARTISTSESERVMRSTDTSARPIGTS